MYRDYFQLAEMPFHVTPNPKFLYFTCGHQEALQHLHYGVRERKGFIVLTGEVGCGKTTLCRKLLEELSPDHYDTALILNPSLTETQLLRTILAELGGKPKGRSRIELTEELNRFLLGKIEAHREIVLIIDESQNLSFELLEQIRMLSNLETDEQKLLQIVLLGQPELKEKLRDHRLRQLRQRILVYWELHPLNLDETAGYIRHRLRQAGANGKPSFSPWAVRTIHRRSGGIPRVINNLCDKALLSAFARESDRVGWSDVRRAIRENKTLLN